MLKPLIYRPKEHEIQAQIVKILQVCGFEVKETTAYRQKGPSGCDKGIPDLLCWHPALGSLCIGLEVKRDQKAKVTPEQADMVAQGFYEVVWTVEMALESVLRALPDDSTLSIANLKARLRGVLGGMNRKETL